MSRRLNPENFTAEKFRWHQLVAFSPNLKSGAKAVAGMILHDLNADCGYAYRSQIELAKFSYVGERQIRRQLSELEKAGFLEVERVPGDDETNHYFAVIPDGIELCPQKEPEATKPAVKYRTSKSAARPKHRTSMSKTPDTNVLQYLEDSFKESRARKKPPAPSARLLRRFPDEQIREQVVALRGDAFARSYLDQASWAPESRTITCATKVASDVLHDSLRGWLAAKGISLTADRVSLCWEAA
ncbi:MAG: helix-turn-helix domain-containing protein [Janthinobacterium lividum]